MKKTFSRGDKPRKSQPKTRSFGIFLLVCLVVMTFSLSPVVNFNNNTSPELINAFNRQIISHNASSLIISRCTIDPTRPSRNVWRLIKRFIHCCYYIVLCSHAAIFLLKDICFPKEAIEYKVLWIQNRMCIFSYKKALKPVEGRGLSCLFGIELEDFFFPLRTKN